MPTIQYEVEIEIEVYCATCGNGLCLNTESTVGRNRGVRQFRVKVCDDCIYEKEKEINELKDRINELEEEIYEE